MNQNVVKEFISNYKETYGGDDYICEVENHLINGGWPANIEHVCEVCNSYRHKFGFDDGLSEIIDIYNLDINPSTLTIGVSNE